MIVGFLVFNRPALTDKVFDAIRQARPRRLLVVADGPRPSVESDAERCRQVRDIVTRVDWPCELETNFSEANLGCRRRVSSGLDWIFSRAEEAMILEDDCLPHPDFFRFTTDLLARYRDDSLVWHIGGTNFQPRSHVTAGSYYFSQHVHVWGWATWRRAWQHYDVQMRGWPDFHARHGDRLADDRRAARFVRRLWSRVYRGEVDTWDVQWVFACRQAGALSIVPAVNLVSNLGFGAGATHTHDPAHRLSQLESRGLAFPLIHPAEMHRDAAADAATDRLFTPGAVSRARSLLARLLQRAAQPAG